MDDSLVSILLRILGGLRFAVTNWLAGMPGAQWGIAIALALPLATLLGVQVVGSHRSGVIPFSRHPILRETSPTLSRLWLGFEVLMGCLALWSAAPLF